ncbi:hypothetical protein BCV72DRAFT_299788 [Rhizopus microsporus var. microsporus]|uniref:DUF2470 domain-containing protein n=1 Tax=Rhizopus microsporus var. microsporus TaxID=86635 RepID=A0A1X0QMW9_RHIZD|nr:hypothetical protein BCV72DRAFT_299788 [Rhizopus microsporus var. microsporus]
MATPIPDSVAISGNPLVNYMSEQKSVSLAYVKYFSKKKDAVSASFKALNSKGFTIIYKTSDNSEYEVFIEYNTPVTKIEDVPPILESMAIEAETALGMPVTMTRLPPLEAIQEAAKQGPPSTSHDAQKPKGGKRIRTNDVSLAPVEEDVFYSADFHWQILIILGLGANALLAYASDEFLLNNFPLFMYKLREFLTASLIKKIFQGAIICHLAEGLFTLGICLIRGWYSPYNTLRWTISSAVFGFASLSKLFAHGEKLNNYKRRAKDE